MEKQVFEYFRQIAAIPHGSGNTSEIEKMLVSFAGEHGLWCRRDSAGNVIIKKPASPGCENAEPVILQGHIDMVCEKREGADIDMATQAITLAEDGDWLHAVDTTLGGDDGIAVAIMMAMLTTDEVKHPPLECIFTSDEEIGMIGAAALDVSDIEGKMMINIDSEEEGIFTVSCAGGVNADVKMDLHRLTKAGAQGRIAIGGLTGGHSGIEIDKKRANANMLMGRLLQKLDEECSIDIVDISGGTKGNVICKASEAIILFNKSVESQIEKIVKGFETSMRKEFEGIEPDMFVKFEKQDEDVLKKAVSCEDKKNIITWLMTCPDGVQNMSADIEGLVETSLNLGAVITTDSNVIFTHAIRSSSSSRKEYLMKRLESLAGVLGGQVIYSGDYPAWEYNKDSRLRDICVEVFKEQYGREPEVVALHAGLECGLIAGKIGEGFDAVSIGPDMMHVHTPDEKLSIESTKRTIKLVCGFLEACV